MVQQLRALTKFVSTSFIDIVCNRYHTHSKNINLKQEIQIKLFSIPNTFERLPIWRYIQNYLQKRAII